MMLIRLQWILPGSDIEYKAKLIGKDPKTDLAVIKIEANNLSAITFTNLDDLMEGDVVFALGNPLELVLVLQVG